MERHGPDATRPQGGPLSRGTPVTASKRSWRAELSDAGLFSYGALCGISLYELYGDTVTDKSFQEACLSTLLKELQLAQSDQVRSSIKALMAGVGSSDVSAFIDLLRVEEVVERIGLQQVPEDLVSVAIKDGCYDARMRVLIQRIATILTLDWQEVEEFERSLINTIKGQTHEMTEEEKKEKDSSALKRKVKKYTMIGLATVGGGALLGLTGGLAAPFLAAGAGAIIGGAGAAALGSAAGVAIIGSLFGVAGAGLGGFKMNRRVGDIEEFMFETLCEDGDLQVVIAISGWITDNEPDFKSPWANLCQSRDQYSLRFESEHLKNMGAAIDYILTFAISAATQETLKYTILSGILAAVAWPMAVLSVSSVIDNPWSVCTHRTAAAGKQLADVLLSREQGKRPVTLVGFSLGARVVFYCLTEMAKRKNCEGIVQDAVMLGAPVTGSSSQWAPFNRVVSGRVVNGYCKGDWLLRFLYRTASVQFSIAGLQPIKWQNRRMVNVDLSHIVTGHLDYWNKIDLILSVVGMRTSADDLVVTGIPATEDMPSSDQWLVVDSPRLPSSGIASEVTTPCSSQFTDPFPGCPSSAAAPGSRSVMSTDSGFDTRDAELESITSATEAMSLRHHHLHHQSDSRGGSPARHGNSIPEHGTTMRLPPHITHPQHSTMRQPSHTPYPEHSSTMGEPPQDPKHTSMGHATQDAYPEYRTAEQPQRDPYLEWRSMGQPQRDPFAEPSSIGQPQPDPCAEHSAIGQPQPDPYAEHSAIGQPQPDHCSEHSTMGLPRRDTYPEHSTMGQPQPDPYSEHSTVGQPTRDMFSEHSTVRQPQRDPYPEYSTIGQAPANIPYQSTNPSAHLQQAGRVPIDEYYKVQHSSRDASPKRYPLGHPPRDYSPETRLGQEPRNLSANTFHSQHTE